MRIAEIRTGNCYMLYSSWKITGERLAWLRSEIYNSLCYGMMCESCKMWGVSTYQQLAYSFYVMYDDD